MCSVVRLHSSVAIQVLVIVIVPVQISPVVVSLKVTSASPQLSVAVNVGAVGIAS